MVENGWPADPVDSDSDVELQKLSLALVFLRLSFFRNLMLALLVLCVAFTMVVMKFRSCSSNCCEMKYRIEKSRSVKGNHRRRTARRKMRVWRSLLCFLCRILGYCTVPVFCVCLRKVKIAAGSSGVVGVFSRVRPNRFLLLTIEDVAGGKALVCGSRVVTVGGYYTVVTMAIWRNLFLTIPKILFHTDNSKPGALSMN